jgi:hypothetical protein
MNPVLANAMKSNRFDALILKFWKENGAKTGNNYNNAWNQARNRAYKYAKLRVNMGLGPIPMNVKATSYKPPAMLKVTTKANIKRGKALMKPLLNRKKALKKKLKTK